MKTRSRSAPFRTSMSYTSMQRTLLLVITSFVFILWTYIAYIGPLRSPILNAADGNHLHYDTSNVKNCTQHHNCPTLDKWLHDEAEVGHDQAVRALLKVGADVNSKDHNGLTALHVSVSKHFQKVVNVLLTADADVNIPTNTSSYDPYSPTTYGWTALHIAALVGDEKIMKMLLAHGGDMAARALDGTTPLYTSAMVGTDGARAWRLWS